MRRLLTWIAFLVLTGGTVVAAVRSIRSDLASTPTFDRADLAAWLTAPDRDESQVTLRRAARQLDKDFHAGFDWQPTLESLAPEQQPPFVERFQALMALLVRQRADAYRAEPTHRRDRFLDNQLKGLADWYVVGTKGKSSGVTLFQQGLVAMSSPQVQSRTPPAVREFATALQAHIMKRSLGRMLPLGGDANN